MTGCGSGRVGLRPSPDRAADGHVQAILRHGDKPLEVSRRCVAQVRETVKHL